MRLKSTCKPRKGLGLFTSLFASQLSFQLSTLSSLVHPSTQDGVQTLKSNGITSIHAGPPRKTHGLISKNDMISMRSPSSNAITNNSKRSLKCAKKLKRMAAFHRSAIQYQYMSYTCIYSYCFDFDSYSYQLEA